MPPTDPGRPPYALNRQQTVYLWLAGVFVASLLVADIVGIKLFKLGAVEHTCGMLTFPVTFLLTDLLNEYYGKRGARRVTWLGLAMGLYVFIVLNVAQAMPYLPADFNVKPEHFDAVFGSAKIMYVASLCAYLVGQMSDIAMFAFLKRITGGRLVWLRATGSTVVSQMIDSFIVSWLAFKVGPELLGDGSRPTPSFAQILNIAATGYTLKFFIAIGITPLVYLGRAVMQRWFGLVPLPPES
jgi:uncharacterized integral membrane protein (TIGR00697 family)